MALHRLHRKEFSLYTLTVTILIGYHLSISKFTTHYYAGSWRFHCFQLQNRHPKKQMRIRTKHVTVNRKLTNGMIWCDLDEVSFRLVAPTCLWAAGISAINRRVSSVWMGKVLRNYFPVPAWRRGKKLSWWFYLKSWSHLTFANLDDFPQVVHISDDLLSQLIHDGPFLKIKGPDRGT